MLKKYKLVVSDDDVVHHIEGSLLSIIKYLDNKDFTVTGTRDSTIVLNCCSETTTAVVFYGDIEDTKANAVVSQLHQPIFERQFKDESFTKISVNGNLNYMDSSKNLIRLNSLDTSIINVDDIPYMEIETDIPYYKARDEFIVHLKKLEIMHNI